MKLVIFIILLGLAFSAFGQEFNPMPTVFGEGSVSSRDFEFNASFTPDGKTVYFSRLLLPDFRRISIVSSSFKNGKWGTPKLVPFSGRFRDADPVLTDNGNRLIFISDRPSPIKSDTSNYNLWFVEKNKSGAWGEPRHLMGDFYKATPYPLYPAVAASGNLYYSSGDAKDSDIYLARKTQSGYGTPEKLSFNSPSQRDIDPAISPDESFIIFSSSTRKGVGGSDLWVSFFEQGKWEEPINLGKAINSPTNEGQAALSPDGKRLYFTTIRNKSQLRVPRVKRVNQRGFDQEFNTIFNGIPNIWVADISDLRALRPAP